MISFVAKKIFGTKNARVIKGMRPIVEHINSLEGRLQAMSDAELRGKTAEFRRQLDKGATLDDLLPEAFAVCREAGRRALTMRHYDVQLIGGMVLHQGMHRRDAHRRGQDAGRHAARATSTRSRARASTSSPSTTTWPAATPSGWAASTTSSACRSASSSHAA